MEETIEKTAFRDGTVTARASIGLPDTGYEAIDGFYRETAAALAGWFERELAPLAAGVYDASDDERKRWRFVPYVLTARLRTEVEGGRLKATLTVALERGGGRRVRVRTAVWDINKQRLVRIWNKRPSKPAKSSLNR